ncbi:hypothetical protein Tasa_017_013 [Tanticharoenia sakaeratensis NBRC 103193]|uniref:Glycosyltransferase n=2 Tax=Tanticharoenia TaxID=444052 RepID=A0A0D6MKZ2_9PROT|nr:hypothetical protein Tasa_017_013 [Tanticharoenia sakaeratensis NBRC 103193]GBQ19499.1 hypothetical protein AA103193_1053 [Tanticharoenia sakaeratensis NBRC 103193]
MDNGETRRARKNGMITSLMTPGLHTFSDDGQVAQTAYSAAVVMPSVLRPSIGHALQSVFRQRDTGPVHILIGVDCSAASADALDTIRAACALRPSGWVVQVLWPGYSTSERHGGLGRACDGGVLRCVLSHLANAAHVAYLDDDNWWDPRHLASLLTACEGHD